MKKMIALFLTMLLLAALSACAPQAESGTEETFTVPSDDASYVYTPAEDAEPLPGGATIALAAESGALESGPEALLWQGIQTFASQFGYTAQSYPYGASGAASAEEALRQAAESGAALVVCRGEEMALALFEIQANYPGVSYLLFDDEPHNADYTSYAMESSVHSVLFREEEAGYLAGYASVAEGYTGLGFIGTEEVPGIVRYCTGFLQGAQAAAQRQGEEVSMRIWFTGDIGDAGVVTSRMVEWYNNGTGVILASGGQLMQSAVEAVNQTGARAFATDWDQNALGERVLGSAVKCYNTAVQRQLYKFFSGGAAWDQQDAGQTERLGYTDGSVALAATTWRFNDFSERDYERLYEQLRNSELEVTAYSDLDTLPETPAVTVEIQN